MSDRVADFDFDLPAELIASRPLAERDASRMMVLDRETGRLSHRAFRDLPEYQRPGDLFVLNDSRVLKARLVSTDGRVEILLVEQAGPRLWKCLVKPGRRMRPGARCDFPSTSAHVVEVLSGGERVVEFTEEPDLESFGQMPIPPYLRRPADAQDALRYQTVFASPPGSVAAPTAGLHFTPEMLARLPHAFLTLHVGMGTFLPVKVDRLSDHSMHEECFAISPAAAKAINAASRIIAVGTTSARVLESQPPEPIAHGSGATAIFIHPPFQFQRVGALLTNFHLPKSTLLMLVCAFAGRERVLAAYREAVRQQYRFFSYGDCILIV